MLLNDTPLAEHLVEFLVFLDAALLSFNRDGLRVIVIINLAARSDMYFVCLIVSLVACSVPFSRHLAYRGTSLMIKRTPLGPFRRSRPRVLGGG